ncbi:MAG: exodeoxyribonuclease VII small subunit [Chloroflexota bacterium]|nr:MAG: exodeoxyribonuclease VII small subunit [Chloroflexota bacterium]
MADTLDLSFEAAFAELEKTIQALEEGGLSLEASITTFEHGIRLAHLCGQHLERAELKVTTLQTSLSEEESFDS